LKTRDGFVSNSSSSSFLVMIPIQHFQDVLDNFSTKDDIKDVIKHLVEEETILGIPCKVLNYIPPGNNSNLEYNSLLRDLQRKMKYAEFDDCLYDFVNAVENNPKCYVYRFNY